MEKKSSCGENQVVGERKREMKRERGKEKIFPVFQRSELNSLRTKVGPRNKSYTWVPKSEFFVEAPRGWGFFPILVPLFLRDVNGRVVQPKHETKFSNIGTVFQTIQDWVLKVGIRVSFGSGTIGNAGIFVLNYFRNNFWAEFQNCLMAEFIAVNDSLEN